MDLQTAGLILQILNLMAVSDGHIAPEEKDILAKLSKLYLKEADIPSWAAEFDHPDDIKKLAEEVPNNYRQFTAKLAYMVISSSREAYQFQINSDERLAFERLCYCLDINEETQEHLTAEARDELSRQPSPWAALNDAFSSLYQRRKF